MKKQGKKLTLIPALQVAIVTVLVVQTFNRISTKLTKYNLDNISQVYPEGWFIQCYENECFSLCDTYYPSVGIRPDLLQPTKHFKLFDSGNSSVSSNRQTRNLSVLLLVLSGDIEMNPGPVKYPCKICEKPVAKNHRAVMCDRPECQQWVHIRCGGITPKEYEDLRDCSPSKRTVWFCSVCENLNLLTSFDASTDSIPLENSFAVLSDSEDENMYTSSDDELETSAERVAASISTSNSSAKDHTAQKTKPKFRRLKLLNINCRGIKSKRKQRDLQATIEQEDPDIICGTESHLDSTYFTSEVFPNTHDIFRKDRDKHGGGTFIGVKKDLLAMQEESMETDCEAV